MRKDVRKWSDGFKESMVLSIILAFVAFIIGYSLGMEVNFWAGFLLGGFFAIILLIISYTMLFKNHRECTYKLYFVDTDTSLQVVTNVLNAKNIPYSQEGNHIFVEDLTIKVKRARTRESANCTILKISPNKLIHETLISSLQEKFDAGFVPIGAYPNN